MTNILLLQFRRDNKSPFRKFPQKALGTNRVHMLCNLPLGSAYRSHRYLDSRETLSLNNVYVNACL